MYNKFLYIYLIFGTVALLLFIYQICTVHINGINFWNIVGDLFMVIALYYLAYKTYHEKKDKELM